MIVKLQGGVMDMMREERNGRPAGQRNRNKNIGTDRTTGITGHQGERQYP